MSDRENDLIVQGDDLLEEEAAEMPAAGSVDSLRILEAVLFASDEICTAARLKAILPGTPDGREIGKMIDQINRQLQKERHPFEIVELGGGYQFKTIAYYHPWVRQIFKEKAAKRLSIQALECLSIIAYRQPLSKAEIEAIRGVISDGAMKTLLEKRLVTIVGRSEKVGRPLLYGTTPEFLKYFGLNKIADLPKIEEFEALAREKFEQLPLDELKNVQDQTKAEAAAEASIEIATPEEAPAQKIDADDETSLEISPPAPMDDPARPQPEAAVPESEAEVFDMAAPDVVARAAAMETQRIPVVKQERVPAAGEKTGNDRMRKDPEPEDAEVFEVGPAADAESSRPPAADTKSEPQQEPVEEPSVLKKPSKSKKRKEPDPTPAQDEAGMFEIPPAADIKAEPQREAAGETEPAKKASKGRKQKEPAPAPVAEEADVFEVNIKEEKPKKEDSAGGDEGLFEIK